MKKNLVILSGAGISAESGIKTFRDSGGLWEEYPVEEVATPEAWAKNPELVQEFYNQRRKQVIQAKPNLAHTTLVEFEKHFNTNIITQNIDDLHERAGSKNVLHLHGEINKAKSSGPNPEAEYYLIKGDSLSLEDKCPQGYPLRPHVVWFGEEVPELQKAADIVSTADILVIIGTSMNVYPAANLAFYTKDKCKTYLIDPSDVKMSDRIRIKHIKKNATEGTQELFKLLT